jgi:MoaA/NifB/PqqE/SkfB family radical SAM enzyme
MDNTYQKTRERESIVSWIVTDHCNDHCGYCFSNRPTKELSEEERVAVQDKLVNDGISRNYYTGGEALTVPYLQKLIAKAHDAGIKTRLNTNGILLTEQKFDELKNSLDQIVLPFDSLKDDLNNDIRHNKLHRSIITSRIDMIKDKSDVNLQINTCVHKKNIDAIWELAEFINSKGISRWKLRKFQPAAGNAVKNNKQFAIPDEEYNNLLEVLSKKYPNMNFDKKTREDLSLRLMLSPQGNLFRMNKNEYGDIYLGNILKDNLNIRELAEQGQ